MSLLPGIRLPRTGFIDWLRGKKETINITFIPYTDEEKTAIESERQKFYDDRAISGFAHEETLTFIQARYLFEVIPCTKRGMPDGNYTYFLYDCRETEVKAGCGEFLDCNTVKGRENASDAGYKHIEWLLSLEA